MDKIILFVILGLLTIALAVIIIRAIQDYKKHSQKMAELKAEQEAYENSINQMMVEARNARETGDEQKANEILNKAAERTNDRIKAMVGLFLRSYGSDQDIQSLKYKLESLQGQIENAKEMNDEAQVSKLETEVVVVTLKHLEGLLDRSLGGKK